ncbi:unnamed protein product [Calypogeia fissa]
MTESRAFICPASCNLAWGQEKTFGQRDEQHGTTDERGRAGVLTRRAGGGNSDGENNDDPPYSTPVGQSGKRGS